MPAKSWAAIAPARKRTAISQAELRARLEHLQRIRSRSRASEYRRFWSRCSNKSPGKGEPGLKVHEVEI
jgi:hypothetical protein